MTIKLYLDEDAQDKALLESLRLHGVDVIGAWEVGMRQRPDEVHLALASSQAPCYTGSTSGIFIACTANG